MAAYKQTVSVFSAGKQGEVVAQVPVPAVFTAPIRTDVVQYVQKKMALNLRAPHAVSPIAGTQTSAESWGTGRAVARIPRVGGGGTSRAGQGAFGNMCRGGRMFSPSKVWRRWTQQANKGQRRYAVASALAASAVPALVMARGHAIDTVPEVPLVVQDAAQAFAKTSDAAALLKTLGADADVKRVKASQATRAGAGKRRNRRYTQRKGPLVVYAKNEGLVKAFRNIPGVETAHVDSLNLLQLAPGGHVGRFIVWTESAVRRLQALYGSANAQGLKQFTIPRSIVANTDVARVIASTEVQAALNKKKAAVAKSPLKKNPLKNLGAMATLNPYYVYAKRNKLVNDLLRSQKRKAAVAAARTKPSAAAVASKKAFVATVLA